MAPTGLAYWIELQQNCWVMNAGRFDLLAHFRVVGMPIMGKSAKNTLHDCNWEARAYNYHNKKDPPSCGSV